jgi:hypothetical protein
MFFIVIVLMTLFASHTSAQSVKPGVIALTDNFPEHDADPSGTQSSNVPSAPELENADNQQGTGADRGRLPSTVKIMAASKRAARPRVVERGNEEVCRDGDAWVVPGVGRFDKRAVYTFEEDELPAGLQKSNYTVQCRDFNPPIDIPYNERFDPKNVVVSDGFLNLLVPGGQKPSNCTNFELSCAEVTTKEQNILYGSFRTNAIFSEEPGTCHGRSLSQTFTAIL